MRARAGRGYGPAVLIISLMIPVSALSQSQPADVKLGEIQQIIEFAEKRYKRGQESYAAGDYYQARREFDEAVDTILLAAIDVRSDDQLRVYYRELIEKINRYQIASLEQKDGGFSEQRYEPSPLDKIASLSAAELEEAGEADETVNAASFNFRFTVTTPVKQFIGYFAKGRGRVTMASGLQRSARYRDMARQVFKEEGVPTDLIWLAQIESLWNPYALSSASAKGIWQFIPATGQRFGLQQSYWVDERSNPEKSTRAAARYLKWLANRYKNNWELALAAYNSGERNVDSAIARAGSTDFWRLHSGGLLPYETRNYVPAILAVITIAKNAKSYGFEVPSSYTPRYETRTVAKQTDLRPLAKKLKIPFTDLLDLNPELQRGVTPPWKHTLRVPAMAEAVAAKENPEQPQ